MLTLSGSAYLTDIYMELNSKLIYGLERLADAFKSLLWEQAKVHKVSPIQIQILLFVAKHKPELCSISHLAKEFNVTKPTISDAVRVLIQKGFLEKDFSYPDSRSYFLFATAEGKKLVESVSQYTVKIESELNNIDDKRKEQLFSLISDLIFKFNQSGIIEVQRTCYACRFYKKQDSKHYCGLLKQELKDSEIRLDCPEFE